MTSITKPLRAVLFDLDGTLVDSSADIADAVNVALAAVGRPPLAEASVRGFVGDGMRTLLSRCLGGEDSLLGAAVPAFEDAYARGALTKTRLYPGIEALLESLLDHRIRLAVVSNKPVAFCRTILDGLRIGGSFDLILGGDSLAEKKPSPAPLRHVLGAFAVRPAEAVVVGDGHQDLRAAQAAGIPSIGVLWGFGNAERLGAESPSLLVGSVPELARALGV